MVSHVRKVALTLAFAFAAPLGCSNDGKDGGACRPAGYLGGLVCDDGLVCISSASGDKTCGHCSEVDPDAVCDVTHACQGGVCVACTDVNACGVGDLGRICSDGGACAAPLVCTSGDTCDLPDAEMKAGPDAGAD